MISRAAAAAALHKQSLKCPGRAVASIVEKWQVVFAPDAPPVALVIPVRVVNPLNSRQHWRTVHARGEREKNATTGALLDESKIRVFPSLPIVVMLTRIGKQQMDGDAVPASLKHLRDSVAKWYGVDDRDGGQIEWKYAQLFGRAYDYAVRIDISPAPLAKEAT